MTRPPTEEQLASLAAIHLAIAQIADALGSESTSPGLVFATRLPDLGAAVAELLPATFRAIALEVPELLARYVAASDPRREILRALLGEGRPTAALCGGASFKPERQDRGAFYVVVFLAVAERAGFNLLIAFPRVET